MASLEKVYHDFPRLAKQSGFHFQLHRGSVNWSEIENLNIDEITEKNNFYLLERNLLNVINCNLEREYDLKILDQNFVKLFKVAQLGIDYLFYCEMYLDRCVILLQEQLLTFQEECESLKLENQKTKEEMNRIKRKSRTQNYQCEKCDKVFISDVYLKYHNKRRHSSPDMPEITHVSHKTCIDNCQQTEDEGKLSTSTQTLFPDEGTTVIQNVEDPNDIKTPLRIKIENLVQELQDLKERLKKTESTLSEKAEAAKLNECHSCNIPGPMHCSSMLMLLPSYLTQLGNGCYEINPGCQISVPEIHQKSNTLSSHSVNSETAESRPRADNSSQTNSKLKKPFEKECESTKDELIYNAPVESVRGYQNEENDSLECNKENVDPNKRNNFTKNVKKPLPPPRKCKKKMSSRSHSYKEDKIMVEPPAVVKNGVKPEEKTEGFNSRLIPNRSTPKKEKLSSETISEIFEGSKDNLSEIDKPMANSNESLNSLTSKKSVLPEPESEFFIKKIINKNSPKLRKISKNFKSSLTSFYDSVSFNEKDLKRKESINQNLKTAVVDRLNNHLRRLGVDPEWSGIPKKTMKQKLNALKHSRRILSKENPTYPVIRQNIEEKLFQRIKKSLGKKKAVLINKFNKHRSTSIKSPTSQDSLTDGKLEFVKSKNCSMYDSDIDSESKSSDSEKNFSQGADKQNVSEKSIIVEDLISCGEYEKKMVTKQDEEFDLSVFQVGGSKSLENVIRINRQKYASIKKTNEVTTDSDNEYNFLENFKDRSFISPKELISNKSTDENTDLKENYDSNAYWFEVPRLENSPKMQNPIITEENTSMPKLTVNDKKKVLFANCASNFDEELSDSPTDDELWSFRCEWAKNVG